ncbi:MAG: hypothetical protein AAF208_02250 [Cyanobacteria bacterium P01_A01_bin.45]
MTWQNYFWNHEDSRSVQPTSADIVLRQQLESYIGKFFFDKSDRTIKNLLCDCRWYVTSHAGETVLVIECPDQKTNWKILQEVIPMANLLKEICSTAKIRICPPDSHMTPHEIRVDEISVYRYW